MTSMSSKTEVAGLHISLKRRSRRSDRRANPLAELFLLGQGCRPRRALEHYRDRGDRRRPLLGWTQFASLRQSPRFETIAERKLRRRQVVSGKFCKSR